MSNDFSSEETQTSTNSLSWWKRLGIVILLAAIAGIYPAMMVLSHKVTNTIPDTVPNQVWDDRKIGVAIEVLERENFYGWAAASPAWHPKSRLTAMPAYQQGISSIISDFSALRAETGEADKPDSDLRHATTLLKELNGPNASDKLHAAIEALRRYHGRKARNLLEDMDPKDLLERDLELFQTKLADIVSAQNTTAATPTRGTFNREIVEQYYRQKGQLHAIALLVKATSADRYNVAGLGEALLKLNTALERASMPAPVTISNPQPGSFSFGGNDIMQQAYLTLLAQQELQKVLTLLADSSIS